jgi:DNA ligase-1
MLEAGRTPFNELDGELYRHGWSFEDVHSVVGRTKNLHPHYHMIQLHIFDLVTTETQLLRTASLHAERAWLDTEATKLVQSQICYNFDEIMKAYRALIDEGYEGIILRQLEATYVRRRSTAVMKFKPKKEDDYEIVAFQEAVSANGTPKNMLGAVMCRGNDLTVFKSGAGQLTHEERRRYWAERAEWIGKTVHVGYQNLTEKGGVPRFGIVIELLPKLFTDPQAFFNPLLH